MAAKGFFAQLSEMIVRALSAGSKSAPTQRSGPGTKPGTKSGTRTGTKPGSGLKPGPKPGARPKPGPSTRSASAASDAGAEAGDYAGDFTGKAKLQYAPVDDGRPDPGEVVWAWVPFEEDHSQGKDRPVLVIARQGGDLLGLMLTSKDHDRDHDQEARHGRYWLDIGAGAWDRQGRPSEVRLDRILQLDPEQVRREGAVLDRAAYDRVAVGVRRAKRW